MQIEEILNEREEQYGNFLNRSKISQDFKTLIHNGESYRLLKADQKEALADSMEALERLYFLLQEEE